MRPTLPPSLSHSYFRDDAHQGEEDKEEDSMLMVSDNSEEDEEEDKEEGEGEDRWGAVCLRVAVRGGGEDAQLICEHCEGRARVPRRPRGPRDAHGGAARAGGVRDRHPRGSRGRRHHGCRFGRLHVMLEAEKALPRAQRRSQSTIEDLQAQVPDRCAHRAREAARAPPTGLREGQARCGARKRGRNIAFLTRVSE